METKNKTTISKDLKNKQLIINREFEAPLTKVWEAWTDSSLLDQWWAPKPWKAKTKSMDFREGGFWLYAMVGPEGEEHWARADYETIIPFKIFTLQDAFCDENGNISTDFSRMHWKCKFSESNIGTLVNIEITFAEVADIEKIIKMGFEEGFTAAHGNLDELLKS